MFIVKATFISPLFSITRFTQVQCNNPMRSPGGGNSVLKYSELLLIPESACVEVLVKKNLLHIHR
jgi:hypothetical protein